MKKLLLLSCVVFTTLQSFSQVFWEEYPTGFSNIRGVSEISIADANNIWMYSYNGSAPTNVIFEYARSADSGLTWTNGPINVGAVGGVGSTYSICSFQGFSATNAYVGIADNNNNYAVTGLYKTNDGGTTWNKKTTGIFNGSTTFFDFGAFFSEQVGVTVGDPLGGYMEIYRTVNGGDTWSRIPIGSIAPIIAGEYAFTNSYEVFGNTCWFLTNKARTYRSSDAGLTWQVFENSNPATNNTPGGKTSFKNELEGIMSNPDTMWNTTDGGATWNEYVPEGAVRSTQIVYVPGTPNTYISSGNEWGNTTPATQRGTSISTDGGLLWDNINFLGDTVNVDGSTVAFFSPTVGFAAGFSSTPVEGGMFKYVGTLLPSKSFSNNKAFTASPNPTSGVLTIAGDKIATVSITDVLGKEIAKSTYSSLDNVTLDFSSYKVGIYLVKVTNAEGNTSTLKIVKQ